MDNIDAPQWADFTAPSPQVSMDDYFLKRNREYREQIGSTASLDSPFLLMKKSNSSKIPLSEISYGNDSSIMKTPAKVISGKLTKSSTVKDSSTKERTYESVISEALNNLQLSQICDKSMNKSCLIDTPEFKTPNRITRSMCAQYSSCTQNEEEHYHSIKEKSVRFLTDEDFNGSNKENIEVDEEESSNNEQSSELKLEITNTSTEHDTSQDKSEPEQDKTANVTSAGNDSMNAAKSKVLTSSSSSVFAPANNLKKKFTLVAGEAWKRQMKRRLSITNQRRMSLNKSSGTLPKKFVSMAEAVSKFHRVTPQRFHTVNVKTTKTEQLRSQSLKLTKAQSPALMCKNRSRPVTVLSSEEKEKLELDKIRQNQIKANPVPKDILKKPASLKKVEKKLVTNPQPFHLTETKKGQMAQKSSQEIKRTHRPVVKTVPSIVSSDEKGIIVKDEEVLYFGIPCKSKKENTKVKPFSFEARNREIQMRKQEKIKHIQQIEQEKVKPEFHARPVPAAVRTPVQKPLNNSTHKPKITLTRSLSFENRVKEQQKKKEEKIKQILEEEKKMRTFKAQKVPEFKPVLVRGRSRDNVMKKSTENLSKSASVTAPSANKPASGTTNKLTRSLSNNLYELGKIKSSLKRSNENLLTKSNSLTKPGSTLKKTPSIPFVAAKKSSLPVKNTENQENKVHGAIPKILEPKCKISQKSAAILTELNTDKRAKQRKEFEEQLKKKEMEEVEMKKREEQERLEKEKAEQMELRKMTEHKARPMPVYKPLQIIKSNKPLTDAQSPAWAKRKGSMH
ncbi:hypothetical protein TKK_0016777 [Trichogramma kaykai]|uniref:TPX2 C-terminal domain-containing protein n=1 Tax=Trichogramma kaykai TaxID=54128 RepID=A0ABD2W4Z2_9HYME